jgi:leucyl aminopeptidase
MSVQLIQSATFADEKMLDSASHVLMLLPAQQPAGLPYAEVLHRRLQRGNSTYAELAKTPILTDFPHGGVAAWLVLDRRQTAFQRHTLLRKALKLLLDEKPQSLTIAVYGDEAMRRQAAHDAIYVACVNAADLPNRKSKQEARLLSAIALLGWDEADGFAELRARVAGNTLARQLTMLPPNELTPAIYREKLKSMAQEHGWQHEEYDMNRLRELGAGAFVAVAQGSMPQDAAIVHLAYRPEKAGKRIALVGKGICFDTGGHNLKPAKYMNGMHEDMNGSAVALGILLAATQAGLPMAIDCWLAIAQNHIGPGAYKQNDVVTALNGTTIEIVHTDAEGRMVLADTLTLASRDKPQFIMDFATLTGSMISAVGNRYSGVLGNRVELLSQAVDAGAAAGERICAFPFDEDYEEDLDSSIADIKQCTLDSEADHVLAARFLARFIEGDVPWLHVDLSSANRKGGLGAVASDVSGFGVGFGLEMLKRAIS